MVKSRESSLYIEGKVETSLKDRTKKVELFKFNFKFRSGFSSYRNKSKNGKSESQTYTLLHQKIVMKYMESM